MKKCTWCGKEYPDTATVCPNDGNALKATAKVAAAAQQAPTSRIKWPGAIGITLVIFIAWIAASQSLHPLSAWLGLLVTSIWAGADASRIKLNKFRVSGPSNATGTFIGCLLLWLIVFPWYLVNRGKVLSGEAPVRTGVESTGGRFVRVSLAIGGMVLGLFMLVLVSSLGAALSHAKVKTQAIRCMENTKTLVMALHMYALDHGGRTPAASTWCEVIQSYVGNPETFHCPGANDPDERCHYALNQDIAEKMWNTIQSPAKTVVLFEADGGWNKSGSLESLLAKPRHGRGLVIGFADGHVEVLTQPRLGQLNWQP